MSNILNSEDFGLKIYNRFPPKYREDDVDQNYALRRFIQASSEGGFKHAIEDVNGITYLIDPDRVNSNVLPILFKQYGLEIFNGIPEEYLRYLLPKLGEAWSKKGSLSVIEFITSSLSGIKTSTEVDYDEQDNPLVKVKFEMDYNIGDYFPNTKQFEKLLVNFLPFYCDLIILYTYMFVEYGVLNLTDKDSIKVSYQIDEEISIGRSDSDSSKKIAVMGQAVMGQAVFGYYEDNTDIVKDLIKHSYTEVVVIRDNNIDSEINTSYNNLNGNLNINEVSCYSRITVGGVTTVVGY